MKETKSTFRLWWQIPRRAGERLEHRQVSFLELFYDLVYVVLIAQLSHDFANHITPGGVFNFIALFIVVWWAWLNGTLYHDLHGNNDVKTRVYTFVQMIGVIGMAIFAHDAVGHNSVGFALSYSFFQLVLTILWWRTGVHDPDHRALSRPYVAVFLINTLLFAGSVFFEENIRYWMWFIAMILSLVLPLSSVLVARKNEVARKQMDIISDATPSLVERFGLFTIIVLGEVVVAIVSATSSIHHLSLISGIKALLGTLIAIGLWWIYFDFISHRKPKNGIRFLGMWYYLHLPMTIGMVSVGASAYNIIKGKSEVLENYNIVFISGIGLTLLSIAVLITVIQKETKSKSYFRNSGLIMIFSSLAILPFAFIKVQAITLLLAAFGLLILPVLVGFFTWIRNIQTEKRFS